ncbi:RDD family protein [Xanthomarina gelatinilytica]|uniref:RDD family protein n=1 Tax=Xanthomarina gelatinilytica TaxID=1137281 RepID=UPI003AA8D50B
MNTENIVLEEGLDGSPLKPTNSNLASTGQRLANYVIDLIFIYIIAIGISAVLISTQGDPGEGGILYNVLFLLTHLTYYVIAEGTGGKTIGKMVTRTRVVNEEGEKPSIGKIIIRTLCRIIPFEPFSALSSSGKMWHDSLSKTYLVKA